MTDQATPNPVDDAGDAYNALLRLILERCAVEPSLGAETRELSEIALAFWPIFTTPWAELSAQQQAAAPCETRGARPDEDALNAAAEVSNRVTHDLAAASNAEGRDRRIIFNTALKNFSDLTGLMMRLSRDIV